MRKLLDEALAALAWGEMIDNASREMMIAHAKKVMEINKVMNLTRITDDEEVVHRHIIDSLWLIPALEQWEAPVPNEFLDVGSGGGWPFVPLKAVWRKSSGMAVEKSKKKARFLQTICDEILPRASVSDLQARELRKKSVNLVATRAVGKLDYIFKECHHVLKPDGLLVCYKGPSVEEEMGDWDRLCKKNHFKQLAPISFKLKDGSERHLIAAYKN